MKVLNTLMLGVFLTATTIAAAAPAAEEQKPAKPAEHVTVGAPSTIPHDIKEFLPITYKQNSCLMCHRLAKTPDAGKGKIPLSHQTKGKVNGDRWNCIQCHVPHQDPEG